MYDGVAIIHSAGYENVNRVLDAYTKRNLYALSLSVSDGRNIEQTIDEYEDQTSAY